MLFRLAIISSVTAVLISGTIFSERKRAHNEVNTNVLIIAQKAFLIGCLRFAKEPMEKYECQMDTISLRNDLNDRILKGEYLGFSPDEIAEFQNQQK